MIIVVEISQPPLVTAAAAYILLASFLSLSLFTTSQEDKPGASAAVATSSAPSPQEEEPADATAAAPTAEALPIDLPLEFLRTVKLGLIAEEQSRMQKRVPVLFAYAEDRADTILEIQDALDKEARQRPRGRRCRWGYKETSRLEKWHTLFRVQVHSEVRWSENVCEQSSLLVFGGLSRHACWCRQRVTSRSGVACVSVVLGPYNRVVRFHAARRR